MRSRWWRRSAAAVASLSSTSARLAAALSQNTDPSTEAACNSSRSSGPTASSLAPITPWMVSGSGRSPPAVPPPCTSRRAHSCAYSGLPPARSTAMLRSTLVRTAGPSSSRSTSCSVLASDSGPQRQRRCAVAPVGTPIQEFGACGADDQQRHPRRPLDEVLHEVERRVVGPVDVLEHEDGRPAHRHRLEEPPPPGECVNRGGPSNARARPSSGPTCCSSHTRSCSSRIRCARATDSLAAASSGGSDSSTPASAFTISLTGAKTLVSPDGSERPALQDTPRGSASSLASSSDTRRVLPTPGTPTTVASAGRQSVKPARTPPLARPTGPSARPAERPAGPRRRGFAAEAGEASARCRRRHRSTPGSRTGLAAPGKPPRWPAPHRARRSPAPMRPAGRPLRQPRPPRRPLHPPTPAPRRCRGRCAPPHRVPPRRSRPRSRTPPGPPRCGSSSRVFGAPNTARTSPPAEWPTRPRTSRYRPRPPCAFGARAARCPRHRFRRPAKAAPRARRRPSARAGRVPPATR